MIRVLLLSLSVGLVTTDAPQRPGAELIRAQIEALASSPVDAGEKGELSVVLLEAPERDMPLLIRIESGPVAFVENRLGWEAVVDPLAHQPRLRAGFVAPDEAGHYEVVASVDYVVCSGAWCRRKHGRLRWTLEVR